MELNQELKFIFANIIDLQKFAESKHAGFIVLNAGLIVGILANYSSIQCSLFKLAILIGLVCFGLSIFLSVISQFPKTKNTYSRKKIIITPNLYFFGHLSHIDYQMFVDELQKVDNDYKPTKFDSDLINQILVNARITQSKFVLFKWASTITTLGFGIIGTSILIKLLWHF